MPAGHRILAPIGSQPVWASGVTYERSRAARNAESATPDVYDLVYDAERPELFLKAMPGHGARARARRSGSGRTRPGTYRNRS